MTTFISYAQNFEDVMLWRALKHVENGFYIDLGAQDPVIDSVSLAFHERGWKGIHVEPTPHYAQLLRAHRPGDTVIEAAVASDTELLTFFEIPGTGISTGDPQIAEQHRKRGFEIREITVPCVRLSSIFKVSGKQAIHWMKVDVEGLEKSALKSWGKASTRPWIVVVESTLPLTQIESHEEWEPLLTKRGYTPVYFDGLNRYYISKEKIELKQAFHAPPNVFDDFSVNGTASTSLHHHLKARHAAELAQIDTQMQCASGEVEELKQTLSVRDVDHGERMRERLAELNALNAELLRLEQARSQREETFNAQSSQKSEQIEELLRQLAASEQITASKLLDYQLKANSERELVNHRYFERERELELRLLSVQEASSGHLEALRKQIDANRTVTDHHTDATVEMQRQAAQREIEIGAQMISAQQAFSHQFDTVRQKAVDENARLKIEHTEKLAILLLQVAEQERGRIVQELVNEQETSRKLDELRRSAETEKVEFLRKHAEEINELKQAILSREHEYAAQMLVVQEQAAQVKKREQFMQDQFELVLRTADGLRLQSDVFQKDLAESRIYVNGVEEAYTSRELTLLAKLDSAQCLRLGLLEDVHRMQWQMLMMRSSFSWQLTAPIRTISSFFFTPKANELNADIDFMSPAFQAEMKNSALQEAFSSTPLPLPSEYTMQSTANKVASKNVVNADTGIELMTSDDQQFVQSAYRLVLGRDADADGRTEYLGQLQAGCSRLHILAQLRLSPEGNARATKIPQLDDQLATATNAKAIATTIEGLFALQGLAFIRAAYLILLGREPDSEGMENCIAQLHSGAAKVEILAQLVDSQEGRSRVANVQEIASATRHRGQARKDSSESSVASVDSRAAERVTATPQVADLLLCDEQEFVRLVFWVFLGRWPDPEAFGSYLKRLAEGVPRMQLLAEIEASLEAVNRYRFMTQVERAIRHHRLVAAPIIGTVVALFLTRVEKRDNASRRLRVLEFENAVWRDRLVERISQTDFELGAIKQRLLEWSADPSRSRGEIENAGTAVGRNSAAIPPLVAATPKAPAAQQSPELNCAPSALSKRAPATRDRPVGLDPHVSLVLAELRSALATAKKVSDENSN